MTFTIAHIASDPIEFAYDYQSGFVSLTIVAWVDQARTMKSTQEILLEPTTGKELLAALPKLQMLLETQAAGPATPTSVQ
ncbi:hypothetical protein ACXKTX_09575 [Burkholderia gladioli]